MDHANGRIPHAAAGVNPPPPTAPTNLTATTASPTQINLSWTASSSTVGLANYIVQRCQGASCTNLTQVGSFVATSTTYHDTGLTPGTSYSYRVQASDTAGNLSSFSNVASATTQTPPTAPNNLTGKVISAIQINLSWTASTSTVGLKNYIVQRCQGAGCTNFVQVASFAATSTTYNDTGLTASTSYSYRVQASDTAGNPSSFSNVTSATTQTPPTAPGNLTGKVVSTTRINLSWTASTSSVGLKNYIVQRCQGAGCTNFAQVASFAATSTTYADTGLTAGTSYSYRVQASDTAGNLSSSSNMTSATTQTPPTAPSNLTGTVISPTQINLTWTASTSTVGLNNYIVQRCQGAGCTNFAQIASFAATTTSYSDTGLTASTSYSYRVQASDTSNNLSAFSNTATAVTQDPPTAPGSLTAAAASTTQINLSWTASTSSIGLANYIVQRCQGAGCTNFTQIASFAATSTTYSDTGLTASTSYSYRVQASDTGGHLSPFSNVASATTTSPSTTINYVQGNYATPQTPQTTVNVPFTAAQIAGDLNVVVVGWNDSTATVSALPTQEAMRMSSPWVPRFVPASSSQSIYYAKNIASAGAGANTVTVTFSSAAALPTFVSLSTAAQIRTIRWT